MIIIIMKVKKNDDKIIINLASYNMKNNKENGVRKKLEKRNIIDDVKIVIWEYIFVFAVQENLKIWAIFY